MSDLTLLKNILIFFKNRFQKCNTQTEKLNQLLFMYIYYYLNLMFIMYGVIFREFTKKKNFLLYRFVNIFQNLKNLYFFCI